MKTFLLMPLKRSWAIGLEPVENGLPSWTVFVKDGKARGEPASGNYHDLVLKFLELPFPSLTADATNSPLNKERVVGIGISASYRRHLRQLHPLIDSEQRTAGLKLSGEGVIFCPGKLSGKSNERTKAEDGSFCLHPMQIWKEKGWPYNADCGSRFRASRLTMIVQCDGLKPHCSLCSRLGKPCVYPAERHPKK